MRGDRQKKINKSAIGRDVIFNPKERIISFKERIWKIELTSSGAREFFKKFKTGFVFVLAIFIFVGGIFGYLLIGRANIAIFYPTSCLGGWQNSQNAQGKPDGSFAAYEGGGTSIFCGKFGGENLNSDTQIKKVKIKLSLTIPSKTTSVTHQESQENEFLFNPEIINEEVATTTQEEATTTSAEKQSQSFNFIKFLKLSLFGKAAAQSIEEPGIEYSEIKDNFPVLESTEEIIKQEQIISAIAEKDAPINEAEKGFLKVSYTLDGVSWQVLGWINEENWQNLEFEIDFTGFNLLKFEDIKNLQISIGGNLSPDEMPFVYLDGLAMEVEYEKESILDFLSDEEIEKLPRIGIEGSEIFDDGQKDFRADENPVLGIDMEKIEKLKTKQEKTATTTTQEQATEEIIIKEQATEEIIIKEQVAEEETTEEQATTIQEESIIAPVEEPEKTEKIPEKQTFFLKKILKTASAQVLNKSLKPRLLKSKIFNFEGQLTDIEPQVEATEGKIRIQVPRPATFFSPGKYKMQVEILIGNQVFVSTQEFTWGVLAINVGKSIYSPGETAYLQMAVLDNGGHTICDADLVLKIKNKISNIEAEFSTADGKIKYSDTCGANNVTDNPDYFAYYNVEELGIYEMKLTNLDNGYEIEDFFEVRESVPFEVERIGATRINPFLASYTMGIKIKANRDFAEEIIEQAPESFTIKELDGARQKTKNGQKLVIWQVDLKAGEEIELKYEYQAPKISPQFYLLGPLKFSTSRNWLEKLFGVDEELIFQETRQWQIASDSLTAIWTGAVNNLWSNGGNWSGGLPPSTGDDLVFPAGASNLSNSNDFIQNTMFNSITISGSGYALAGNDIIIGQGLAGITDSAASGGNTISLNIRLDVTRNIFVTNSAQILTISGMIAGAGGFNKEGLGTLVLSGANTYGGVTKINAGVLNARHDRALGTILAGTEVVGGAALEMQNGISIGFEALVLRGYGVYGISGAGALRNISGNNTFGGVITLIAGGAVIASDADTLTLTGGVAGAFPLVIDGAGDVAFNMAPIAIAAGTVTKNGSGTLIYNFPNTYTGLTTINNGKLLYGINNAILSGNITINGGVLDVATYSDMVGTVVLGTLNGGAGTITGSTGILSSGTWTVYAGTISAIIAGDGGAITKSTPATATLTRANQFSGNVTVSAGILVVQNSMALGVIDGTTTVSSGATLQIDGNELIVPEYITFSGLGVLNMGAIKNSTGNNSLTGTLTMGAASMIKADSGTTLTIAERGLTGAFALTIDGDGDITFSTAPINTGANMLIKNGNGALTLNAFNTYSATTTINNGPVILSGGGAITLSTAMTINTGGALVVDNSAGQIDRLADTLAIGMNGGDIDYYGSSSTGTMAIAGVLTLATGQNRINIHPASGGHSILRFASLVRTAGASALIRGVNLGSTPGAGVSTLLFSTAPTLVGDDGAPGTPTVSIIQGVFGDNSMTGNGTDMVTYGRGNNNGLRLLNRGGFSNEYTTNLNLTNANVRLTSNVAAITTQINSLTLSSGASITNPGSAQTMTLISGNILNLATNAIIAGNNTTLAAGAIDFSVRAVENLDISADLTTTGGLTKSGTNTLTFSTSKSYTGTTSINRGTLLYGVDNAISTGNVTVDSGTLDIADYDDSVGAVILQGGTITGGNGILTASSYSLRDGIVSAIIGGSGTLTKISTGTNVDSIVVLTRNNVYTGATAISSGILQLGAAGNGTNTPLGTTDSGTTVSSGAALDLNGFTLGTLEALSINGTGVAIQGALMNSSSSAVSYGGAITLAGAARIGADKGKVTVSGNISGASALTVGGYSDIDLGGVLSTITTVTKEGLGIYTPSNNNSYTGSTTISAGTLKIGGAGSGSNTPLGTIGGATAVTAGATLDLNGFSLVTAEPITNLNGVGGGSGDFAPGALVNSSSSSVTFTGTITIGAGAMIRADAGAMNLSAISGSNTALILAGDVGGTISGVIGTGTGTLTKIDIGAWTLSGINTYTGVTTVARGTLRLGTAGGGPTNSALGTNANGTTVNSGAVLDLNGLTLPISEALTINGRGINNGGALITSATCSYSGTVTQATDSRIASSVSGQTLTLSGALSGTNFIFRMGGTGNITLTGATAAAAIGLTKDGAGTLNINASQGHTGPTIIEAGTVAFNAADRLAVTAVTVLGGTWNMGGFSDTVGVVTLVNGTITNGTLTGATNYTVENGTIGATLAGAFPLIKNNQGTVTMTATNTISSTATINAGTIILSGSGTATSSTFTINLGGKLTLDNSGTNVLNRLGDALAVTINGGDFNFIGNSAAVSSELAGALTLSAGHNVITVSPGSGGSTTMTFASLSRTTGATALFRGTSFGSTPAANVSTLMFTAAPTLTGAGGGAGTTTISVIKGGFGDNSLTGTGTDMVTYNIPSNGLRLLNGPGFSGEYAGDFGTAGANVKLTANRAATTQSINSLILNGYNVTNPGSAQALTLADTARSGNVLINTVNNIAGANTTIGVANNELCVLASASSTISAIIGVGTGALTLSGTLSVTATLSAANTYTGTTFINRTNFVYGASNVISSGGVTVVGGTLNLDGNSDTIGALSINAGTVATGAGTLTLGGTVTTIANNNVSSVISGNLGLGANRDFNIGDGLMDNDAVISAVISGSFTVSKITGAGVLVFSGHNTYDGSTTISAGILRLGADGGTTNTPLGTTSAGTTVSGATSALDLNGFTLGTTEGLTLSGAWATGALQNNSSNSVDYGGLITLGATSTIISNYGDINIINTGTITGATFGLTVGGAGNGALASIIGTTTGTLTKNGVGTWTLSGASTYTGTTSISAGTFRLGTAGSSGNTPLGTNIATTTVSSGAMLDLNGFTLATAEPLTINGTGIASRGAVTNSSSSATGYSGVITLGTAPSIVNYGSGELTLSGNIIGSTIALTIVTVGNITQSSASVWSGTTSSLTKQGSGILTLAGQNSITGAMTVSTGVLRLGANGGATNTPFGTIAGGVIVSAGAVLDLSTFTVGGASTWEPLTLNGSGINNNGALISDSASNNSFGIVTFGSNARVTNSGTGIINFVGAPTGTFNYVFDGSGPTTISGIMPAVAITITKYGTGILTLSAAHTQTGLIRINNGTVRYGVANAILSNAVTIAGGTLDINGQTDSVGAVILISGTIGNTGAAATLTGTAYTFESGAISAPLGGTSIAMAKNTGGALTINAVLTNTGTLTINAGIVQYLVDNVIANTAAITVAGGALDIGNYSDAVATVTLTSGSIIGNAGILTGTSYAVQSGTISAVLAGAVALTKSTVGTVTLSGVNTYTGVTTIQGGILSVGTIGNGGVAGNIGAASAVAGNLVSSTGAGTLQYTGATASTNRNFTMSTGIQLNIDIALPATELTMSGASSGTTGTLRKIGPGTLIASGAHQHTGLTSVLGGILKYGNNNVILSGDITVDNGILDFNSYSDTVGTVTLTNGGQIIDSAGTSGVLTSNAAFAIQSGTISVRLNAVSTGVSKTTSGRVILSGNNTFAGTTSALSAGALNLQHNNALGASATGLSLTITSGAMLELQNNITLPITKTVTVNGSGVNNDGALRNISGNNVLQGDVTLNSSSVIGSDLGTLTLGGTVTGGGSIGLIKVGEGTLSLISTVNVGGDFTISVGTVSANGNAINIGGNWTNNGVFTAGASTVTFNGSAQQTLVGAMIGGSAFNVLVFANTCSGCNNPQNNPRIIVSDSITAATSTIITPSMSVRFAANATSTFTNIDWNGQATTTRVALRSSVSDTPWNLVVTGSQTVLNVDAKDSDARGGNKINATDSSNLDSGGNFNWNIGQSITLTISPATLNLPSLIPGIAVFATSTATVDIIGGDNGYSLRIKRNSSTSTLATSTIIFPDYAPAWNPGTGCSSEQGNATIIPGPNFSFRVQNALTTSEYCAFWWGNNDDEGTEKYGGMPTGSQIIMNCPTCNNGSTVTYVKYRADSPYDQKIETYAGEITFTALINL